MVGRRGQRRTTPAGLAAGMAVLAALLAIGFLSPWGRARLLAFIHTAYEQTTELYRDLQGYDETL